MKHLLIWTIITMGLNAHAQLGENTTPTYYELIQMYHALARDHSEIAINSEAAFSFIVQEPNGIML